MSPREQDPRPRKRPRVQAPEPPIVDHDPDQLTLFELTHDQELANEHHLRARLQRRENVCARLGVSERPRRKRSRPKRSVNGHD